MNPDINENVFKFCMGRLQEKAFLAIQDDDGSAFCDGKRLAYYEAIDSLRGAVTGLGIDPDAVGLDFDPELLLK